MFIEKLVGKFFTDVLNLLFRKIERKILAIFDVENYRSFHLRIPVYLISNLSKNTSLWYFFEKGSEMAKNISFWKKSWSIFIIEESYIISHKFGFIPEVDNLWSECKRNQNTFYNQKPKRHRWEPHSLLGLVLREEGIFTKFLSKPTYY